MSTIATIVIGRNEGDRLLDCLSSIPKGMGDIIYVDSGSTDDSVAAAQAFGAIVVQLDVTIPFTAARARNAGVAAATKSHDLIQFIDGDCALDPNWIGIAKKFLSQHPDVAVVCGRRRERFPGKSVYNRLCDDEWNTPIGEAKACGGDALMRFTAFQSVDGFNPNLIAGEEPELCVRLRAAGWRVWRIDAEMTSHDAAITQFSQFWKRAKRSGHAFAEGSAMHGAAPEYHGVAGTRRALFWGVALPAIILVLTFFLGAWAFLLCLAYPLQCARLALRDGAKRSDWERAVLLTVGKFAEAWGVLTYYFKRQSGQKTTLIEYK